MPEWLLEAASGQTNLSWLGLVARLGGALLLGGVVGATYVLTHGRRRDPAAGMLATLVLLTVLIAMVTLVIDGSIARAFSLVGALAIVRFRTVVEDTRDTAFVIFAVTVGMAAGTGYVNVLAVGMPLVAGAAFLFRPRDAAATGPRDATLTVRVGAGRPPEALLGETFAKHLERSCLTASATARQGAALDVTYAVRLRRPDAALALVAELSALEGVQEVELRQA